jgi:hypothetical protein
MRPAHVGMKWNLGETPIQQFLEAPNKKTGPKWAGLFA